MKYTFIILVTILLSAACGKKSQDENPGGTVPLGKGITIPVLKTEKLRKAKLTFDLTEIIRKDDKVDVVVMVTNRGSEAMLYYMEEELALTDNNGYIYKVKEAKIDKINQFNSGMRIAKIPEDGKVKSIISFREVRDDALSGRLFFRGEVNRGKTVDFKVQFDKVKLRD